jgi:hypothetical protein
MARPQRPRKIMMTTTEILIICLVVAVIGDIFLGIRVVVLRNYLHFFEEKLKEIEIRLSPKKKDMTNEQEKNQ